MRLLNERQKLWLLLYASALLCCPATSMIAQTSDNAANDEGLWRFGLHAGANFNFLGLGFQDLPVPGQDNINFRNFELNDGTGLGIYGGLRGEYISSSWWGAQLRLGYDSRSGDATEVNKSPEQTFDSRMEYVSVEALLRVAPFDASLPYFTVGPLLAFNTTAEFDLEIGPEDNERFSDVELDQANNPTYGISGGVAMDIVLGEPSAQSWVVSPFLEGSWMVDQRESNLPQSDIQDEIDDIWSTVTVRAGVALTMQFGPENAGNLDADIEFNEPTSQPADITARVFTPLNGVVRQQRIEEYFPLIPHVFFDKGSQEIPSRYVRLNKAAAQSFEEDALLSDSKIGELNTAERYQQQMKTYHNVLNVLGARMRDNPSAKVTLIGSAPNAGDGDALAASVRRYLTEVFGIDAQRITTEGRKMPRDPSGTSRTPQKDLDLVAEENRRVEIVSNDPQLRQPVKIEQLRNSIISNDVVVGLSSIVDVRRWFVNIENSAGVKRYGPFRRAVQRIDPMTFMRGANSGTYTAKVEIEMQNGSIQRHEESFTLRRRVEDDVAMEGIRYSIVFPFAEEDAVRAYDKFLRDEVAPLITNEFDVLLYGHTDIIGTRSANYKFSQERAQEVRDVLRSAVNQRGVKTEINTVPYGESDLRFTFDNTLPEGRFYNRTVIIELIRK